jgi:DNA-binding transcriptional MocR family regulator
VNVCPVALEMMLLPIPCTVSQGLHRAPDTWCSSLLQGGYFVWLQLEDSIDTETLLAEAVAQGVNFAPGVRCNGEPNCLRLCFAFYTAAELRKAVAILASVYDSHRRSLAKNLV